METVKDIWPAHMWRRPGAVRGGRPGRGFSYVYVGLPKKGWTVPPETGLGFFYKKAPRRDRIPPEYESIFIHHYKRWVVGPSRAEISFNYLF